MSKAKPKGPDGPKMPELYYDAPTGAYWVRLSSGLFLEQDSSDVKLRMRRAGFSNDRADDGVNPCEAELLRIQDERNVHYSGALAGRRVGLHDFGNFRVLVTTEARGVYEPLEKKVNPATAFPNIARFLDELLPEGQADYLTAWLRERVKSLRAGVWRPGPCVVFVGTSSCGKSFAQWLITQILGGRSANPLRYLTGKTQFNQDLAESEHWSIEDGNADTSYSARRQYGDAIKQVAVNEMVSVHPKGGKAIQMPGWKAMSQSVNCEAEELLSLPSTTEAVLNKMCLFQCGTAVLSEDRGKNQAAFLPEIHLFRSWLCQSTTPAALRTRLDEWKRYGHDCFHHASVLEALNGLSPEEQLLDLIDEVIFRAPTKGEKLEMWTGKAQRLQSELLSDPAYRIQAGNMFKHANTCGTLMAKLARRYPHRVETYKSGGVSKWRLMPEPKGK